MTLINTHGMALPTGPRLSQGAMLAADHPEDVGFERGKSGCTAVALIVVILVVAGVWALSNWLGGGSAPSQTSSPTPTYQSSLPPSPS